MCLVIKLNTVVQNHCTNPGSILNHWDLRACSEDLPERTNLLFGKGLWRGIALSPTNKSVLLRFQGTFLIAAYNYISRRYQDISP